MTNINLLSWRDYIAPGLGSKVLSILLLAFLCALVVNSYYSISIEKKALSQQMDREGKQLAKASAIFSTEFLLLEDYPMLSTYTEGLVESHPDIQHIIIKRNDKKIVALSEKNIEIHSDDYQYYYADVRVDKALIGHIEIAFSTVNHQVFVDEHLIKMLMQSIIIFILLALVLFILVRRMLTDPIHQLVIQANILKNGDMDSEISLVDRGELNYLARVINEMRINVKHSQDLMVEQNQKLDLIVAKRTAELNQANQELLETHSKLIQSDKMAAIGQLSAGVAHEINNPVGFVYSNIDLLDDWFIALMTLIEFYDDLIQRQLIEDKAKDKEAITRLIDQGIINDKLVELDFDYIKKELPLLISDTKDGLERVTTIVSDLKDFSHVSESTWSEVDLLKGLKSTLNIVSSQIKYKAKVILKLEPIDNVYCISSQINQVFLNIIVNASQAIKQQGIITIKSKQINKRWVCISIFDSGEGIEKDKIDRIFEPFYTSKPVGVGTGLGLSVSYGIIKSHHGRIEVESNAGQGTAFHIWLPVK